MTGANQEVYSALTGADGAYTLSGVPQGDCTVRATAAGYVDGAVSGVAVVGGQTTAAVNLALAGGAALTVYAQDQAGQAPIPGVNVYLYQGQTLVAMSDTDETGAASFAEIPLGEYEVRVAGYGWSNSTQPVTLDASGATVVAALAAVAVQQGTVQIGSEPGADIPVMVTDADGNTSVVWTDQQGQYTLGSLPDGTYRVALATGQPAGYDGRTITLGSGQPAPDLAFQIDGGRISGQVFADAQRAAGAAACTTPARPSPRPSRTTRGATSSSACRRALTKSPPRRRGDPSLPSA